MIAELERRIDGLVGALVKLAGTQAYPVIVPIAPCQRPHADHGYWYPTTYPYPTTTWSLTSGGTFEGSGTS
jgi:hypothetical protein